MCLCREWFLYIGVMNHDGNDQVEYSNSALHQLSIVTKEKQ